MQDLQVGKAECLAAVDKLSIAEKERESWYLSWCMDTNDELPVRIVISDKITYSYMEVHCVGKLVSGCVQLGDILVAMPNEVSLQVIEISSDNVSKSRVVAEDYIEFVLIGTKFRAVKLQRGSIMCSPESLVKTGRVFDGELLVLKCKNLITSGYSCVLHIQSAVEEVAVRGVIATIDKKTGEKKRAKFVKQDEKCILRFECPKSIALEPFKEYPCLGRFTLKNGGKTIAIGKVVKIIE